ncbi:MAG: DUF1553 domain-containing protein [Acidobacteria bacterium]|nr:DUF1553 domain-containing protein [Acidobacteriota bacterium]
MSIRPGIVVLLLASAVHAADHWSLVPVRRPQPPKANATGLPEVDRFIRARLEKEGIASSPEAPRAVLLRRLSLDLIGLPPTPAELASFLEDQQPDAWQRQVNRLLASPHYGEKWGRHWLDLARYADSDGFRSDRFRPHAWRYRQWLIDALNRDLPFDQFTLEQIAGDLLPNATRDQRIATGFHRNTLTNREGGIDPEQFRVEQVIDRTNTVGTVWLGLTVGCAQCHDHKYDPISQRDYYRLFAFFNDADEDHMDAPMPGELGPHLQARPAYDAKRREILEAHGVPRLQAEWEVGMIEAAVHPGKRLDWDHAFDDLRTDCEDGEKILRTPAATRTRRQARILTDYFLGNYARVISKERKAELKFDTVARQLRELDATLPPVSEAPVLRALDRKTHLLIRGDFKQLGEAVEPGTPAALPPLDAAGGRATRLDLARWLVSRENPLTARVAVNRIWQEYFGRGLARTSENFGNQGERPTHPELLDWLAAEFMESGWSLKHVHRLVVSSATYRQSSHSRADLAGRDPENKLFARQTRLRLTAEAIRDSALAASGLLSPEIGGPSVRPPQPGGEKNWKESTGRERYRRGMYIQLNRTAPYPLMVNFDAPNGYGALCRRGRSNTPLQALNLLNDPAFVEAARTLAWRTETEGYRDFGPRLDRMFELCLARLAAPDERDWLQSYWKTQPPAMAWTGLASVLLNLDEFITRE